MTSHIHQQHAGRLFYIALTHNRLLMLALQSDDMCASPAKDFDFAPLNLHTYVMTQLVSICNQCTNVPSAIVSPVYGHNSRYMYT